MGFLLHWKKNQKGGSGLKGNRRLSLLLLIPVICLVLGLGLAHLLRQKAEPPDSVAGPDDTVLTVDDSTLTLTDLSYYYWSEYHYYMNAGKEPHRPDAALPLSEQAYDASQTWHEFFLSAALQTARENLALCSRAEDEGFVLPEQWFSELQTVQQQFSEYAKAGGFYTDGGEADLDGYLKSSYGEYAEQRSFFAYLYDSYCAAAYADALFYSLEPADDEVADFFRLHREHYEAQGIFWDDANPVDVCSITLTPASYDAQGWEDAEARAAELRLRWLGAGGGEQAFLDLGRSLQSDSSGSAAARWNEPSRLLPTDELDEALYSWCFEPLRQVGDCGIVRTESGYELVFFLFRADHSNAYLRALEDLRYEAYRSEYAKIVESSSSSVTKDKIVIAAPLQDEKR